MASYIEKLEKKVLPVIALRGLVIFPHLPISFELSRKQSVLAMQAASSFGESLFFTAQIDPEKVTPDLDNVEKIGCIATVKHAMQLPSGNYRVIVEGIARAEIAEKIQNTPYLRASVMVKKIQMTDGIGLDVENKMKAVKRSFEKILAFLPKLSPELITSVQSINSPDTLSDFIAANILHEHADKQAILSTMDPIKRLEVVLEALRNEYEFLKSEFEIHVKVKDKIDRNQRDISSENSLRLSRKSLAWARRTMKTVNLSRMTMLVQYLKT